MTTPVLLGSGALGWVRDSLAGGRKLALAVRDGVALEHGHCWADLPRGAPDSFNFHEGPVPGGSSVQREVFHSRAAALLSGSAALVVENDQWRPGDPSRQRGGDSVVVDSTLLQILRRRTDEDLAGFAYRNSSGYPTNVFFVDRTAVDLLLSASTVTDEELRPVLAGLTAIAVAAWDAEGFIWWSARGPSPGATPID